MDWAAIGGIVGGLVAGWAEYKRRRERAKRIEAERTAADLQRILDLSHEMEKTQHLVEQAKAAMERAKVR